MHGRLAGLRQLERDVVGADGGVEVAAAELDLGLAERGVDGGQGVALAVRGGGGFFGAGAGDIELAEGEREGFFGAGDGGNGSGLAGGGVGLGGEGAGLLG